MKRPANNAQIDFLFETDASARASGVAPLPRRVRPAPGLADSTHCRLVHDPSIGTLWVRLKADAPVKFTRALLADLRTVHDGIASWLDDRSGAGPDLRYQVFGSDLPGIFSLGGDLALFRDCIRRGDARTLRAYAREAVDLVHATADAYGSAVTTIALVQGQALGGGFEAALAAHVLIAERGSRMGLPEVMFNMFPGMGAWQLLCRRLPPAEAERMILGGRTWTAEELHALGVVDVLADEGQGEAAVQRYIRSVDRHHHGRSGFRRARNTAAGLDRGELHRMADVWVETALGLGERDLETIDYLLRAQARATARSAPDPGLLVGA